MKVLVLVEDLLFRSRIEAHLRRLQVAYAVAPPRSAGEALSREQPTHVVVNLAEADADALTALGAAGIRVLGFGPHVDRERFLSAQQVGAQVVANSRLEHRLDAWLVRGDQ